MKDLSKALDDINSKYGDGALMKMSDAEIKRVDTISTGSIRLDNALGIGGIPRGRFTSISGQESTGKTTLMIQSFVECQKLGLNAALIDVEHAFDMEYAISLGLDTDMFYMAQPDSAEEALNIMHDIIATGNFGIVCLDSVAALVPQSEIDGDIGDSHIGLVARMMGQSMRKMTPTVQNTNTAAVFINQLRMNVNTFGHGPKWTEPSSNALKFFCSVRLDMRRKGSIAGGSGESDSGNLIIIKVLKNKLAPPLKVVELEAIFGRGFCRVTEVMSIATKAGIINRSGAWYNYGDFKVQGASAMTDYLIENPDLVEEIIEQITGGSYGKG